jgi:hypothetical protein
MVRLYGVDVTSVRLWIRRIMSGQMNNSITWTKWIWPAWTVVISRRVLDTALDDLLHRTPSIVRIHRTVTFSLRAHHTDRCRAINPTMARCNPNRPATTALAIRTTPTLVLIMLAILPNSHTRNGRTIRMVPSFLHPARWDTLHR